ncbi:MAG: methylated-DNA--[protein]-cysteine S-methyltransferase [bacterium]
MNNNFSENYNAFMNRDSKYEGLLIVAVKTTKIFCRPTCTARRPKQENIEFYKNALDALANGFRPCKICKPMEMFGEAPESIQLLIKELHKDPFQRIKDYNLKQRGIEPSLVRRWFKKNHNLTFQAYQRMLRLNGAFNNIKGGNKITETAFESGYESLSGFNTGYANLFGSSPKKTDNIQIINILRITTPIGPMFAGATKKGICLLEFTDRRMLETELKDLRRLLNAEILPGENNYIELLEKELEEYFKGVRKIFTVPLDTPGTDFQKKVWKILLEIPYGVTRSYKQQAILLNKPLAVRAVGTANGSNRVSIVIPCHRVIGENGNLTGYGGGLPRKKWLLDHEKKIFNG